MLRDPEVVAELDELHEQLRHGDLEVASNDEARRIVGLPPEDPVRSTRDRLRESLDVSAPVLRSD